jgi:hypothetical protein
VRTILDKLNDAYAKTCVPTEYLAADKIIVLFNDKVIFRQYTPNKHKWFWMKIYKLCKSKGYAYNMTAFTQKQKYAPTTVTAKHAIMAEVTARIKNVGHKLLMDNFLSSPELCDDLLTKTINCCGTVRPVKNAYVFWKETESEMD